MNEILQLLAQNPAVKACGQGQPRLSCSSLVEEAVVIAASMIQSARPMIIIKNNL